MLIIEAAPQKETITTQPDPLKNIAPKQPMKKLTQAEIEAARRGIAIQSKPRQVTKIQTKEDFETVSLEYLLSFWSQVYV